MSHQPDLLEAETTYSGRFRGRLLIALVAAAVAVAFSGCSTTQAVRVKPWQREYLADSTMDPNRDPLGSAMMDHVYFSREAAEGGKGVGEPPLMPAYATLTADQLKAMVAYVKQLGGQ